LTGYFSLSNAAMDLKNNAFRVLFVWFTAAAIPAKLIIVPAKKPQTREVKERGYQTYDARYSAQTQ
jgi:hypothetical protein